MREIPKLLKTAMVQAILDGIKVNTRMPMKIETDVDLTGAVPEVRGKYHFLRLANGGEFGGPIRSPLGVPGDVLWVRESATVTGWLPGVRKIELTYEASAPGYPDRITDSYPDRLKWVPKYGHKAPNGVYKEACRLKLRVKRVWVERIYGNWLSNPWVWCCEFEVMK